PLIADLDGDGHDALIASFGAWRTYDVRVLRPRGDALEITARRETGNVNALCVLRRPDGALRIAVAKDDLWANRRVFPEPPHTGPSAGVYLLDPEGPSLAVASYTPITLSPRAAPQLRLHKLECADLDGDGRDELLVSAAPRSVHDDLASTVLLRSGVGDELHALRLEGLRNPVIAEIDGATPYELFVQTGEQSWVLGAGAQQLAPAPRRALTAAATPAGLDDPALRERWRRAERLAALGLFEVAAPVMLDLAGIVGVPELASRFTARAAEYVARAGDERRAIELLARIQEPWSAVRRASDEIAALLLRLGELRAAAIRWRELGGPPPEARAIVPFRGDELAALADPSRVHAIEFARASELPWTVVDTAAVVRDPARRTLRVRSGDAAPAALSLPLAWDGGPLVVTVELTIEHIEYGGSIGVGLRDASGRWPLSARVATVGGSGVFERRWFCADHWVRIDPDVPAERAEHVTITLAYSPATSGRRCFIASEDDTHGRLAEPLALAGPLFLDIGALAGSGAVPEPTVVDATVSRVELIGLSPGDADPRSPDERARALLIEGRVDEARTLLDTPTLRDRALLAAAFAERGRWSDAHALLTPLARLDDEALVELAPVLAARARELSPLLEPLLAARYLALEQRAFTVPTLMHYHERFAQELILRSFAGLDRGDPLDPEVAFTLLLARGRARRQLGDLAGARADLQRALGSDARGDVSSAAAELAQLLLHHGEPDAARAVLNDALARATDRRDAEFTLERVAALRPLLSAP
ncbi:MAG: hypothetical protein KC636_36670, partial [Myxococcales bacterium]|nr:hypothetical protein [Myxococcales bacterium]